VPVCCRERSGNQRQTLKVRIKCSLQNSAHYFKVRPPSNEFTHNRSPLLTWGPKKHFSLLWNPRHYGAVVGLDACFFISYSLAWSTRGGSVSMSHLIVRPVFVLGHDVRSPLWPGLEPKFSQLRVQRWGILLLRKYIHLKFTECAAPRTWDACLPVVCPKRM